MESRALGYYYIVNCRLCAFEWSSSSSIRFNDCGKDAWQISATTRHKGVLRELYTENKIRYDGRAIVIKSRWLKGLLGFDCEDKFGRINVIAGVWRVNKYGVTVKSQDVLTSMRAIYGWKLCWVGSHLWDSLDQFNA